MKYKVAGGWGPLNNSNEISKRCEHCTLLLVNVSPWYLPCYSHYVLFENIKITITNSNSKKFYFFWKTCVSYRIWKRHSYSKTWFWSFMHILWFIYFLKPLYDSYSIKSWHSYVHVSSITYFCLSGKKAMK